MTERNSFEMHCSESIEGLEIEEQPVVKCDIRCIICRKELDATGPDGKKYEIQPMGGIMCTSEGNFGSEVFDPYCSEQRAELVFLICDECLMERLNDVIVFVFERKPATPIRAIEYFGDEAGDP